VIDYTFIPTANSKNAGLVELIKMAMINAYLFVFHSSRQGDWSAANPFLRYCAVAESNSGHSKCLIALRYCNLKDFGIGSARLCIIENNRLIVYDWTGGAGTGDGRLPL
jgi:hypothetical protein